MVRMAHGTLTRPGSSRQGCLQHNVLSYGSCRPCCQGRGILGCQGATINTHVVQQLALLCRLLPYMFYNAFVLFPSEESPKPLLTDAACIKIVDVALVSICGRFFYLFRCPRRIFKLVTSRSMIREEAEVAKLRTYFLNCVLLFLKEDYEF